MSSFLGKRIIIKYTFNLGRRHMSLSRKNKREKPRKLLFCLKVIAKKCYFIRFQYLYVAKNKL